MNSPEKEATDDEAVRAGVPSVAAAGRAQEGQGAAPLLRGLQEAGPAGGRRRQGAGHHGVQTSRLKVSKEAEAQASAVHE